MRRFAFVLAALVALTVGAEEKTPLKVLAIGNSYSTSVLTYLPSVAAAAGESLDLMNLYHGSCSLKQHWDNHDKTGFYESFGKSFVTTPSAVDDLTPANATLDQILSAVPWDVVTLQQSSDKSADLSTYEPYFGDLLALIRARAPTAEIVIHQTWSWYPGHSQIATMAEADAMYDSLRANYATMADTHTVARVIPVGYAVQLCRHFENLNVQAADCTHLSNPVGCYLQACVWAERLFGKDARDFTDTPSGIDAATLATLRSVAHQAATAENLGAYRTQAEDEALHPGCTPVEPQRTDVETFEAIDGWERTLDYGSSVLKVRAYTNTTATYRMTLPAGVTQIDYLVVGGGGAGAGQWGGGGGAGGFVWRHEQSVDGVLSIRVGAGGRASTSGFSGSNGGDSTLIGDGISVTAAGGGGGACFRRAGGAGGSGGGAGGTGLYAYAEDGFAGGTATVGQGCAGGGLAKTATAGGKSQCGAGGGGAGAAGQGAGGFDAVGTGAGGAGLASDITGETVWYAGGGAGGSSGYRRLGGTGGGGDGNDSAANGKAGFAGANGRGGGGGGGSPDPTAASLGGNGGDGVVIVRWLSSGKTYNYWTTLASISAPLRYEGETATVVPPVPRYGAESMTATIARNGGAPVAWDGTVPSAAGSYVLTWTVPETAEISGTVETLPFVVKAHDEIDPSIGWAKMVTNGTRVICVRAYTNTTATYEMTLPDFIQTINYLVVAGGGGGGGGWGGGGGAGGFIYRQTQAASGTLSITVGAGGAGSASAQSHGTSGSDSTLTGVGISETAKGGGCGRYFRTAGGAGGSGGGAGGTGSGGKADADGGAGTSGQGSAGGKLRIASTATGFNQCGAGGGGAGEPGQDAGGFDAADTGKGGDGLSCSITGEKIWYAGGGGGGSSGYARQGGAGGGGAGGVTGRLYGLPGVNGLGGGGGGGYSSLDANSRGGRGGDGVVIVSYQVSGKSENHWITESSISKAEWYEGEESGVVTPPVAALGAETMTAMIARNSGTPVAWDGTVPTTNGAYVITWTVPETAEREGLTDSVAFAVRSPTEIDPAVGWSRLVTNDTRIICVRVYTNTTATFEMRMPSFVNKIDYLVVAGGGGGGGGWGGGGGAGGLVYRQAQSASGTLFLTVGAGGAGALTYNSAAVSGTDSTLVGAGLSVTASGGGGGSYFRMAGAAGGSGGGAGGTGGGGVADVDGGAGTSEQGSAGGNLRIASTSDGKNQCGAGGGGAGEAGQNAGAYAAANTGKGGDGLPSSITGEEVYYAGGGGGGSSEYARLGGAGGGGAGGVTARHNGLPGVNGLGGGGGGGFSSTSADCTGGRGGDGVVIIAFQLNGKTPNYWLSNASITKTRWYEGDEPGVVTPPVAALGAETMTATIARNSGAPVAWDGLVPTTNGAYVITWTVPETATREDLTESLAFTVMTETEIDPSVGWSKTLPVGGDRSFRVLVFTNTTATHTYRMPSYVDTIDCLVVAGGGGGGGGWGGGGGAGGFVYRQAQAASGMLSVTVGAGGAGAAKPTGASSSGTDSTLVGAELSVTAKGGGCGNYFRMAGVAGGSGGGAGGTGGSAYPEDGFAGGAGTSGQGSAGGSLYKTATADGKNQCGAGGGGAGEPGQDAGGFDAPNTGKGGDGLPCSITGEEIYYAGGGAGGSADSVRVGGAGGGGDGGWTGAPVGCAGTDGLGGGGGGGQAGFSGGGGRGGDGVVILRFELPGPRTVTFVDGLTRQAIGSPQVVAFGASATPPTPPEHAGFLFDRWNTDAYLSVTKDLTVTANYIAEGTVTLLHRNYADDAAAGAALVSAVAGASANDTIAVGAGRWLLSNGTGPVTLAQTGLTIRGASADPRETVIDGGGVTNCVVLSAANAVLSSLTVSNGVSAVSGDIVCGGGVRMTAAGLVTNCLVTKCVFDMSTQPPKANIYGTGVYASKGLVKDCVIEQCEQYPRAKGSHARLYVGGAGLCVSGTALAEGCDVRYCHQAVDTTGGYPNTNLGGGAYVYGADAKMTDCRVYGNTIDNLVSSARCYGGGVAASSGVVSNCFVFANTNLYSGGTGGGFCTYSNGKLVGCTISNNFSRSNGGGGHFESSGYLIDCLVVDNKATSGGGTEGNPTDTSGSVYCRNYASSNGGGHFYTTTLRMKNTLFLANACVDSGAAIRNQNPNNSLIEGCCFQANRQSGYCVHIGGSPTTATNRLRNCVFFANTNTYAVFTAYVKPDHFIENCTFVSNKCSYVYGQNTSYKSSMAQLFNNLVDDNVTFVASSLALEATAVLSNNWTRSATGLPTDGAGNPVCGNKTYAHDGGPGFKTTGLCDPSPRSVCRNAGLVRSWMVNAQGRPDKQVFDCGDGSYTLTPVGTYGVHFEFNNRKRRWRGTSADIGACEFDERPGMVMILK